MYPDTAVKELLDRFSEAMVQHIEFYTVGQYTDWPDDPAASYSVADCLWQIHKYVSRHGRNRRPGQDRVDLLKVGHYAAIAASKIGGLDPGERPRNEALSARSWEWLTVLYWMERAISDPDPDEQDFRLYKSRDRHMERLESVLDGIHRRSVGPSIDQLLELIFHAGLVWCRTPAEPPGSDRAPVRVRRMHPDAELPVYKSDGAAGADIRAAEQYVIDPDCVAIVRTGIALEIPDGYEGQIRSRSGISTGKNLLLLNGVGTVDADYRGELFVPLKNIGDRCQAVQPGDRVAQLFVKPVESRVFIWAEELSETVRADGGFGSTGVN